MGKRGQSSFEYIAIIGVILVIMIPFFYYATSKVSREVKFRTAEESVEKLADAADSVAVLGPGTRRFVTIQLPSDVNQTLINGTEILVQLLYAGKASDIYATTNARITGSIQKAKGTYKIAVEALDDGSVYIGAFNDTTAPSIIWTSPSGNIDYFSIILQATTNEDAVCRYASTDISYASMSSTLNGSLYSHESVIGSLSNGSHLYYARCKDTAGNTMNSSAMINFTIIINTSLLAQLPQILLEGPKNDTLFNFNYINFTYNVSSPQYNISSCTLFIRSNDNLALQTNTDPTITENKTQSNPTSIGLGNYTWHVNCTDTSPSAQSGVSEYRLVSVNTTGNNVFLTSCAGNCGFSGYSDGTCRQEPAKCTQNGETNIQEYDTFCTGGAQSDTCCCKP